MYYKVMVLEIKADYCLAMADDGQVLRIKKKGEMKEGDCIYVLNEDLYSGKPEEQPEKMQAIKISKKTLNSIIAVAAALMLCLSALIIPRITDKVYAVVSVDSGVSLQVQLDEKYKIRKAVSYEGSVSEEQLKEIKGLQIDEAAEELGVNQPQTGNTILIGYALEKENDQQQERKLKSHLQKLFSTEEALYLKGSIDDIKQAERDKQTLGLYIAQKALTEDQIEEVVDDMSREDVLEMVKKQPALMKNDAVRKALEKDEKAAKKTKKSNQRKAAADDDNDDDYDTDDDDDDVESKSKAAAPTSKNDKNKKPTAAPQKNNDDDDNDTDADDEAESDDEEEND